MKAIFITTPIYYVNAKPHIGHAYTTVACDVFARFHRMLGHDVKFTTGTDEHGNKIEQIAKKLNKKPQEFVDDISLLFLNLLPALNISNDDFIRTTQLRHKKAVAHFWNKLYGNGYIYLGEYSGWYDMQNEAYFSEDEINDGKSPLGGAIQFMTEPCYFFKLSEFGEKLLKFYDKNPDFIFPLQRRNEVISFVKRGLADLAISRTSFNWGISVPNDPKHVIYVWLDALTNYLTLNGYPENENQSEDAFWQSSHHFVGKEIVRFHAIYWPAFLMAADMPPPKHVVSHGWWLSEGEKMSKSLGNVQDPLKYCALFGSDALRYFLLRELPFGSDGNFSLEGFVNRYNSILSNSYGNLCQRVLSFICKGCDKIIYRPSKLDPCDVEFIDSVKAALASIASLIEQFAFSRYLEQIELAVSAANKYVDAQKPWVLKDSCPQRMQDILFILVEQIYAITKYFWPVIPLAAEKILQQINVPYSLPLSCQDEFPNVVHVNQPEPAFMRIDVSDLGKFDVYSKD
ncbi:methionine--tRNA ligase [Alphaproteobacteria bacterium]|nr:methionine--tRNA ligase [Alphaproteobacteria bacterium]